MGRWQFPLFAQRDGGRESAHLRRRGLIRDGFDAVPFRDNLLAF